MYNDEYYAQRERERRAATEAEEKRWRMMLELALRCVVVCVVLATIATAGIAPSLWYALIPPCVAFGVVGAFALLAWAISDM